MTYKSKKRDSNHFVESGSPSEQVKEKDSRNLRCAAKQQLNEGCYEGRFTRRDRKEEDEFKEGFFQKIQFQEDQRLFKSFQC